MVVVNAASESATAAVAAILWSVCGGGTASCEVNRDYIGFDLTGFVIVTDVRGWLIS